ncbi:MAG: GTP 3',8-cyclase MoaA [Actinobacteria bacterium]|nr:GTP 3',8-cyclase MoaA [Actinomycetota bacterium]
MSVPTSSSRGPVSDRLGRPLRDLRVSVTDRCNFRCRYCMPREAFGVDHAFVERDELLTFEEIARLVRLAVGLGVRKVRLTGGEPLVRRDLPHLVAMLAGIDGIEDLALTTNGSLLAEQAGQLAEAGLHRITVSLDALDEATFRAVSDTTVPLSTVLEGIDAAVAAGLHRVKLNAVVKRGVNDGDELLRLATYAREHGHVARFIEYMDVGSTNGWRLDDVVPAREIVDMIHAVHPLEPMEREQPGAVATRYRYQDGGGEIGIVASVTRPFCATCVRARISPVGELFTCLFASRGRDLREVLRDSASDADLTALLAAAWGSREDRYSELRSAATTGLPKVEMSYIGG